MIIRQPGSRAIDFKVSFIFDGLTVTFSLTTYTSPGVGSRLPSRKNNKHHE